MKETLFELNGGTYSRQGDHMLPDVKLPDETEYEIGVWGDRRRQFRSRSKFYVYVLILALLNWRDG